MEAELQRYLDTYESTHDYDEYRGVMTALPRAACIMPSIRGAWQIGWIFSNRQAERLRRYSPLCYVAPILPAQPPLNVRYHALTGFPVSAFM